MSFGSRKGLNYKQAMQGMAVNLGNMYEAHRYLAESMGLSAEDRERYNESRNSFRKGNIENAGVQSRNFAGRCTGIIIQSRLSSWMNMIRRFWRHTQMVTGMR